MFISKERDLCDHNGYVSKTDGHSCKSEVQYILVTPKEGIKEGDREGGRVIENQICSKHFRFSHYFLWAEKCMIDIYISLESIRLQKD